LPLLARRFSPLGVAAAGTLKPEQIDDQPDFRCFVMRPFEKKRIILITPKTPDNYVMPA
jgi:hypothetical protein